MLIIQIGLLVVLFFIWHAVTIVSAPTLIQRSLKLSLNVDQHANANVDEMCHASTIKFGC
jgi:hypothetical protein